MTGVTGEYYTGLLEFEDTLFCIHMLRPGDLFVDVGANVGTYTIAASAVAGANVLAIEPSTSAYENLLDNLRLNHLDKNIEVMRCGLSNRSGVAYLTNNRDALNAIVTDQTQGVENIKVQKLDEVTSEVPLLMKIDVEGHEQEVLEGSERILKDLKLVAVILETTGRKVREKGILETMEEYGFSPVEYNPFDRKLKRKAGLSPHNTLFVRDFTLVESRVESAPPVTVNECLKI
jgi:FkbM family methyltransferase